MWGNKPYAKFEMSTRSICSNVRNSILRYLKVVFFFWNDKFIVSLLMIHSPRFFKVKPTLIVPAFSSGGVYFADLFNLNVDH